MNGYQVTLVVTIIKTNVSYIWTAQLSMTWKLIDRIPHAGDLHSSLSQHTNYQVWL
jgi:hypothetical protein